MLESKAVLPGKIGEGVRVAVIGFLNPNVEALLFYKRGAHVAGFGDFVVLDVVFLLDQLEQFVIGFARQLAAEREIYGGAVAHQKASEKTSMIARSEEHTSELQSLMRISYAVFCLKKNKQYKN